jgi:thiol:disulfide interchange protein DsbC
VLTIRQLLLSAFASLALAGSGQVVPQAASAAAPAAAQPAAKGDIRSQIAKRLDIKVEDVRPSPIPGLFEVRSGAEVGYVSADGRYYLDGDVFEMDSKHNLTEDTRKKGRLALLAGVKDEDTIIFAPKGATQHTVTVFTDVDCVHCRHLHSEIGELNRLGIRVRYMMFPRGGPDTETWRKAESVWCSADRRDALTRAKKGETLPPGKCETPVAAQYELGRQLGISGTPGIITETGEFLAGYASAAYLAAYLEDPAAAAAAAN